MRARRGLEALALTGRDIAKVAVHLARRRAEDQGAEGVAGNLDRREGAENVDFRVGQNDACPRRVLDREARPTVLAGDAPDRAAEVVARQRLHVLDLQVLAGADSNAERTSKDST